MGGKLRGAGGTHAEAATAGSEYRRALDYLFARTTGAFKFGLERTEALLRRLGNPERRYPCLHVAGTNGKGSVVATLAALLAATGRRVATYTSPHLVDFRERIIVGGEPIREQEVAAWIARHGRDVEELGASFFEATTALAFDYFARAEADIAVIEVGLGGRLDSTNVIDPVVAGVTSIGVDHTEYLGDTLEQIAAEKAGIFKRGRPAVIGEDDPAIADQLAEHASRVGAAPVVSTRTASPLISAELYRGGTRVVFGGPGTRRELWTPLAGAHQGQNLVTAVSMHACMGAEYALDDDALRRALRAVRLPGRFQREGKWIFDVAHNPEGARVLAATLRDARPAAPLVAVLAVLSDKDWRGMMEALAPVVDSFVLSTAPSAPDGRVWDLNEAAEFARARGFSVHAVPDFEAALDTAESLGQTVLVAGSFHTVGDAMLRLQVSPLGQ